MYRFNRVIVQCWEQNPDDRPTFTDLVGTISTLLEEIAGYMDLSVMPSVQCTSGVSDDSQCMEDDKDSDNQA